MFVVWNKRTGRCGNASNEKCVVASTLDEAQLALVEVYSACGHAMVFLSCRLLNN